ncbi:hypothetical protein PsorP6_003213 [Peronosclerospora sorghi]|uniref:Uncharacterized protein n=1 Tax=Peronosclerospora sorghi TaxID=230839 RepID=A0ACC0VKY6_9STRA|nr:hypothetical protein PsorP6_003213 [Peronosclerospora sorghi]
MAPLGPSPVLIQIVDDIVYSTLCTAESKVTLNGHIGYNRNAICLIHSNKMHQRHQPRIPMCSSKAKTSQGDSMGFSASEAVMTTLRTSLASTFGVSSCAYGWRALFSTASDWATSRTLERRRLKGIPHEIRQRNWFVRSFMSGSILLSCVEIVKKVNGSYSNANCKGACVDARHGMPLKCLAGSITDIIVGREFDHVLLVATGAADDHSSKRAEHVNIEFASVLKLFIKLALSARR